MTRSRILSTIRTADPGSDEMLSAVAWLVKREEWQTIDELLGRREAEVLGRQKWSWGRRVEWLGAVAIRESDRREGKAA